MGERGRGVVYEFVACGACLVAASLACRDASPGSLAGLLASPLAWTAGWFLALWPLARLAARRSPELPRGAWLSVLFLAYAAGGVRYATRLQASGDEPHYLLMAQSLWQEHDLDLRDNVERRDFELYTPGPIAPHYGTPRRDGTPYPAHSPGLPLILAPVFAVGGRKACVVVMALAGAALAMEAGRWARLLGGRAHHEGVATFTAAVSPLAWYSMHIYTEVPAALAAWSALRVVLEGPSIAGSALAGGLVSALPWLHVKMIPVAAVIGAVALWRLRGRERSVFIAIVLVMAGLYFGYLGTVFGTASPMVLYGSAAGEAIAIRPLHALLGVFLDRGAGLLPYAPVFLLAALAYGCVEWRERTTRLGVAGMTLAILAPILLWRMWWGGLCPPGRFLVPLLPLLGALVAVRVRADLSGAARAWATLVVAQALLVTFAIARPEDRLLLNRPDRPPRLWAALSGPTPIADALPALAAGDGPLSRSSSAWVGAVAAIALLDAAARRRIRWADRLLRGPTAYLALAIAAAVIALR